MLGRFHFHAQVATMSRFSAAPRQGHMDRLKRFYSYAIRTKDYAIGPEMTNLIISYYQIKILTGHTLYMVYVHEILPDDRHARTTWQGCSYHHHHGC